MNISSLKGIPTLFVQALFVATAVVLAVVAVTRWVAPLPLSITQTTTEKSAAFSATGRSSVTTIPDRVEVTLGVSRREDDIKQAQAKANEIINKINTDVQAMGVSRDDIKTQNYSIFPIYDYQTGSQRVMGYSVDVSLMVSLTDFDKLNRVIDMATAAGANQVSGIQFKLSEAKEKDVKAQARAEAIADAKVTAEELAKLAGMKLGKVINVIEEPQFNGIIPPYPEAAAMMGKGGGAGAPTNVEPGSTMYTYSVTVSYETL